MEAGHLGTVSDSGVAVRLQSPVVAESGAAATAQNACFHDEQGSRLVCQTKPKPAELKHLIKCNRYRLTH